MREHELFELLEGAGDAAFAVDQEGVIRSWNAAAAELFGYSASEALGRPCHQVLQGRGTLGTEVCRAHCDVWACAERGRNVPNFDLDVRAGSGERRWVNVSNLVYRNARSGRRMMIHLARDISEQKQREQVFHQMLELSQQFSGLASARAGEGLDPVQPLSPQQREILRLFAQGKDAAEVAQALDISPQSLRNHLHRINQKLHTHSRLAAVTHAQQRQLI